MSFIYNLFRFLSACLMLHSESACADWRAANAGRLPPPSPVHSVWWQRSPLQAEAYEKEKVIPLNVKPKPTTCPPPSGLEPISQSLACGGF